MEPELSIGALSEAVGIPVPTLRTWERRYGFPLAVRRPSGHRRYPATTVASLKLVKRLLELGHKPSELLGASDEALRRRLGVVAAPPPPTAGLADTEPYAEWFDALQRADRDALARLLHESWGRHGCVAFLDEWLAPFLVEIGRRWSAGRLGIGEEHFASHVISDFLASRWREVAPRPGSPVVIGALLASERHVIGLEMAAVALALAGWDVRFLGADTPGTVIAEMAHRLGARAVALGSSPAADREALRAEVEALCAAVGPDVAVWLGGAAVAPELAVSVGSMGELLARAAEVAPRGRSSR